jgi:DNA polymerase III alpha subunit
MNCCPNHALILPGERPHDPECKNRPVVHLHNHSDASFDAIQIISAMFAKAVLLGQPAIALTDHGNSAGDTEAANESAKLAKTGIFVKAIHGLEAYLAVGDATREDWIEAFADDIDPDDVVDWTEARFRKTAGRTIREYLKIIDGTSKSVVSANHLARLQAYVATAKPVAKWGTLDFVEAAITMAGSADAFKNIRLKKYYHITLLAMTPEGKFNLNQLHAWSCRYGYAGGHPRIDLKRLAQFSKGIIALTGCLGGPVQSMLAAGDFEGAAKFVGMLQDMLGKENVFTEIMSHGLPVEKRLNPELKRLSLYTGAPLVATNDAHYTSEDDADLHDTFLASLFGKDTHTGFSRKDNPKRWRFSGHGYYLRSSAEMRAIFDPEFPDACDNTLVIAERIENDVLGTSSGGAVSSAWAETQGGKTAALMESHAA